MAEELKHGGCRKVDLALFCVRLDTSRFPIRAQYETITKLNQVFGREFWKYCLFVFTFANNIQQLCPVGEDLMDFFSRRCNTLEDRIRATLKKHVKLQGEELDRVRGVPVGSYKKGLFRDNPWALPDREDWFIMFWLECTEHMQSSALSALLQANYHRLDSLEAVDDASETFICPPSQFNAYERLLQATSDEIHDVKQQIEKDKTNLVTRRSQSDYISDIVDPYFDRAIAEASGEFKHVIFIMHGAPGSGKTSVQRLMLGEPPLPEEEQNSTDIMERPIKTHKIATPRDGNSLSKLDKDEFIRILRESVAAKGNALRCTNTDLQSNRAKLQSTDSGEEKVTTSDNQPTARPTLQINSSINGSGSSSVPLKSPVKSTTRFSSSVTFNAIKEKLSNVESPHDLFKEVLIYLVDSGGQPQFSDVLPLLFQSESLYIVVIRLDVGLHEKYKNNYHSNGERYELPDCLELTQYQTIKRVCQIAKAQSVSSDPKQVVIIATHLDGNETKVKEFNEELMSLHSEYDNCIRSNDFQSRDIIFPVNAMATGKEREQHTRELQECLFGIIDESIKPVDVPLKWFLYEIDLDEASQSTRGIVNKEKCFELGSDLEMNTGETESSLKFFSKLGIHLYHDDFPDLVLVDMHPLIARLSALIKASFVYPKGSPTGPYTQLKEYGLFDKKLLENVFKKSFQDTLSEDDFINIAQCLKIIVSAKDGNFFIPSVLPVLDNHNDSTLPKGDVPCGFHWRGAFLPSGFFFTLIVALLEQTDKNKEKYFALRNRVVQYRNKITLDVECYGGVLAICNEQDWICVHYSCSNRSVEDYIEILQLITHAIRLAIKYFSTAKMALPEFCFLCVCCKHGRKRHRCKFNPRGDMCICTLDANMILPLSDEMKSLRDMQDQSVVPEDTTSNGNSALEVFRKHNTKVCDVVSNTTKLGNDLATVRLIPDTVLDSIKTNESLSRYEKVSLYMDEIRRSLTADDNPATIESLCDVLYKQESKPLDEIANDMLTELGKKKVIELKKRSTPVSEFGTKSNRRSVPSSESADSNRLKCITL